MIKNNAGGKDAKILKKYGEPSWNFQVVRFIDGNGKDLIPRRDRINSVKALVPRMKAALKKAKRKSEVLSIMEPATKTTSQLALSQACFWTGERVIGAIDGVVSTEAGWLGGREVTLVEYQPDVVTPDAIIDVAKKRHCANTVHHPGDLKGYRKAADSHQKHTLNRSPLAKLDLTPYQETKINAFIGSDVKKALSYLTPRQREMLN